MIYTSYFAKLKNINKDDKVLPIAICSKSPDWYKGAEYKRLTPKYQIFAKYKQDHDAHAYTIAFITQVLGPLDPLEIYREIKDIAIDKDPVLICYEKPEDFCHRHLVSSWLNNNGFTCKEY